MEGKFHHKEARHPHTNTVALAEANARCRWTDKQEF
jgi:hypothetical protein